jgi:RND family efflux transporter MFP subunit
MTGLVLLLLALVGAVIAVGGRAGGDGALSPARAGRAEPPQHPASVEADWPGVAIAEESVDLAAPRGGRLELLRVQVGERVKKGDVVAMLEFRSVQLELAVAEAELQSRRAEQQVAALALEEAHERVERRAAPGQLKTGAISEEEVSTARYQERMAAAKLEITRAQVLEHEARVAQLRQQVAETSLRAPFDGVVASRFVTAGALLQAGQPVIHLLRQGPMQVRFAVPASRVRHVPVGQRLVLEAPEQGWVLGGQVTQVAPEVDVAALKVFAIAELESAPGIIVPAGTMMRVRVAPGAVHAGSTLAPESASSPL